NNWKRKHLSLLPSPSPSVHPSNIPQRNNLPASAFYLSLFLIPSLLSGKHHAKPAVLFFPPEAACVPASDVPPPQHFPASQPPATYSSFSLPHETADNNMVFPSPF